MYLSSIWQFNWINIFPSKSLVSDWVMCLCWSYRLVFISLRVQVGEGVIICQREFLLRQDLHCTSLAQTYRLKPCQCLISKILDHFFIYLFIHWFFHLIDGDDKIGEPQKKTYPAFLFIYQISKVYIDTRWIGRFSK